MRAAATILNNAALHIVRCPAITSLSPRWRLSPWPIVVRFASLILFLDLRAALMSGSRLQTNRLSARILNHLSEPALSRVRSAIPLLLLLLRLRRCYWSSARRIPRRTGPYVLNMQDGAGKPARCRHLVAALLHGEVVSEVQYGRR